MNASYCYNRHIVLWLMPVVPSIAQFCLAIPSRESPYPYRLVKHFRSVILYEELMREERGVCRCTLVHALAFRICRETDLTMDGRGSLRVYPDFISMHVFVLHVVCQFVPR